MDRICDKDKAQAFFFFLAWLDNIFKGKWMEADV